MSKTVKLSENDKQVLDFMFDPFLIRQQQSSTTGQDQSNDNDDDNFQDQQLTQEQLKSKNLELKAIQLSQLENKNEEALKFLNEALKLNYKNPSILNNRAQVFCLLNQLEDAKLDLDQAIELCSKQIDDVGSIGSNQQKQHLKNIAKQAYCQRALIYLKLNNDANNNNNGNNQNYYQLALNDMNKSADLGNEFAKNFLVKFNPYAALCNKMLKEMFEQYNYNKQ